MVTRERPESYRIHDSVAHTGLHLVCVLLDSEKPQLLVARLGAGGREASS